MEQLQLVIGHALVQTELMGKTCDTLEAETNQKVQSLEERMQQQMQALQERVEASLSARVEKLEQQNA